MRLNRIPTRSYRYFGNIYSTVSRMTIGSLSALWFAPGNRLSIVYVGAVDEASQFLQLFIIILTFVLFVNNVMVNILYNRGQNTPIFVKAVLTNYPICAILPVWIQLLSERPA